MPLGARPPLRTSAARRPPPASSSSHATLLFPPPCHASAPTRARRFFSWCFYNSSPTPSIKAVDLYDEDKFECYAAHDLAKGDELTITYKSLTWREQWKGMEWRDAIVEGGAAFVPKEA